MANNNFIVQNGLSIGGAAGATITADPTTGAVAIAPAATASVPNPTATVFTTAGTVTTVATTGGVANVANIATASNSATVGTGLTTFSNVALGNIYVNGSTGASGQFLQSNGAGLTWQTLSATSIANGTSNITIATNNGPVAVYVNNAQIAQFTSTGVSGTLTTVSQPNVTSLGTLTGLTVAGTETVTTVNANAVNAATIGNASAVLYGTLNSSSASQPNITTLAGVTSIGASGVTTTAAGNFTITGSLTVNGTTTTINNTTYETTEYVTTINATNVNAATIGNTGAVHTGSTGTFTTSVTTPTVTATTVNAATIGNASAVLYGTLNSSSASQTNITAVGTLTGLTSGNILPSGNLTVNLGSTTAWFNNIYGNTFVGTSTSARYADLAENYQADKFYNPGLVMMFGGTNEVTLADADTTAVAGIVSTNPAHLMNGGLTGATVVPVALMGRVPCMIIGPIKKGDLLVSAGHGYAKVNNTPAVGSVIGKALEDFGIAAKGIIEVVVGRV